MNSALRRPRRDVALDCAVAVRVDDEDPVAAGVVVEGAVRHEHGRLRIARASAGLDGLAALNRLGLGAVEVQVDLELAVAAPAGRPW